MFEKVACCAKYVPDVHGPSRSPQRPWPTKPHSDHSDAEVKQTEPLVQRRASGKEQSKFGQSHENSALLVFVFSCIFELWTASHSHSCDVGSDPRRHVDSSVERCVVRQQCSSFRTTFRSKWNFMDWKPACLRCCLIMSCFVVVLFAFIFLTYTIGFSVNASSYLCDVLSTSSTIND